MLIARVAGGIVQMSKILTIDLGTTYFKLCLFDCTGKLLALQRVAPPVEQPERDWWQLSVEGFRTTIKGAIHDLAAEAGGLADVKAMSFATQANSFALFDEHDNALHDLVLWLDMRAEAFADQMERLAAMPDFRTTTGMPMGSHQMIPAKLLWIRKHHPDIWPKAHRLFMISDYLSYWMTGRHVSEAGMAGLSALVDIHRLDWWPQGCQQMDVDVAMLPQIVRAGTDLGPIRSEVVEELGLPADCRYVVGCLDQYAGAIGAGNVIGGGVSETTGTVLATVRCADGFDADPPSGVFQGAGFDPGVYFAMDFGSTSANLLEAYRNSLSDRPDFDVLGDAASQTPPGAEGLSIKGDPDVNDPAGMFVGREKHHGRGHEVRAILEGVAFALAAQIERLYGQEHPTEIRSVGGAARSDLWLQIKADVLGCPVLGTTCQEPTSLGAAMLASRALGMGNLPDLAQQWVQTRPAHLPDPEASRLYRKFRASGSV